MQQSEPTLIFRYEKGGSVSTFHADGILGGPQPSGNIYIAFYTERLANPRSVEYLILDDGKKIGENPVRSDSDIGIVRELQTAVVMNLPSLKGMIELLNKFVTQAETQQNVTHPITK
jgi:hypothetical protein